MAELSEIFAAAVDRCEDAMVTNGGERLTAMTAGRNIDYAIGAYELYAPGETRARDITDAQEFAAVLALTTLSTLYYYGETCGTWAPLLGRFEGVTDALETAREALYLEERGGSIPRPEVLFFGAVLRYIAPELLQGETWKGFWDEVRRAAYEAGNIEKATLYVEIVSPITNAQYDEAIVEPLFESYKRGRAEAEN